jgi:hypothetical protein
MATLMDLYTVDHAALAVELARPTLDPQRLRSVAYGPDEDDPLAGRWSAIAAEVGALVARGGGRPDDLQAQYVLAVIDTIGTWHEGVHPAIFPGSSDYYPEQPFWPACRAEVLARYGEVVNRLVDYIPQRMTVAGLTFDEPWLVTWLGPDEAGSAAASAARHAMSAGVAEEVSPLESAIQDAAARNVHVVGYYGL